MRIYNREDFMGLPAGVIFAKGKPCYFGGLCVKAATLYSDEKAVDFVRLSLETYDCFNGTEFVERFDEMLNKHASYPFDDEAYGRDGTFDKDDVFLVYEREDLLKLAEIVADALSDTAAS